MKINDSTPSLVRVGDLGIGWIAPPGNFRSAAISQDALDRVVAWPALKAQKTNRGNLVRTKAWIFCFQIDNQLAHLWRKTAPGLEMRWGRRFVEQADHAQLFKSFGLVVQRAFTGPGFFGPRGRRLAKQHDGAQPLVLLLLRPERLLLNRLPIMGPFSALPLARRHDTPLSWCFSSSTERSVCPDKSNASSFRGEKIAISGYLLLLTFCSSSLYMPVLPAKGEC